MQTVDSLIHARWVVPIIPRERLLENHSVVIDKGRIVDILPTLEVMGRYQANHESHLDEHVLLPGFINAHTHAAMSLLRGIADDLPLKTWLEKHIWPLERQWALDDFVYDGTRLAIAEMLKSGTTCFADMYFFPEAAAEAVHESGIRARLGTVIIEFPTRYAETVDEYFSKGLALADEHKHDPLISVQFAPHAPYTVSDEQLKRIQMLSTELGRPVHMHVHETAHEVEEAMGKDGMRPLERLNKLGMLSPDFQAVHMTELSEEDIKLISDTGVHVIHCPESNMKLASGACPVSELLKAGVNVALGTDGAASNNDLDMLGELKTAALLGKLVARDASALSAWQALEMATINGAKALQLDDKIGTIERGKQADLQAIHLGQLEQQPLFHPVSQIVYASQRQQISDVWVAGKHLMKDRKLTTLKESELIANAYEWQKKLSKPIKD